MRRNVYKLSAEFSHWFNCTKNLTGNFIRNSLTERNKTKMATLEQKAQQLIRQQLSLDVPSHQELIQLEYTGFMHYYLHCSKNDQTMSTTANNFIAMKLARIDQPRDNKK